MRRTPDFAEVDLFDHRGMKGNRKVFCDTSSEKWWYPNASFLEVAMRTLVVPMLMTLVVVGGVDDPPLGGPYGGTTDPTDPNGGQNSNNNSNNNTN